MVSKCETCGKEAESSCARCMTTFYCSRQCQRNDWPNHQKMCHNASHFPFSGGRSLGIPIRPPRNQNKCYLRISGDIDAVVNVVDPTSNSNGTSSGNKRSNSKRITKSNKSKSKFQFSRDIAITRKQFIKFTKSPSHLYKYLNEVTFATTTATDKNNNNNNNDGPSSSSSLIQVMHNDPYIQNILRHKVCDICHAKPTSTTSTPMTTPTTPPSTPETTTPKTTTTTTTCATSAAEAAESTTTTTTMSIFLHASNCYRYGDKQSLEQDGIFRILFLHPLCVCAHEPECRSAAADMQLQQRHQLEKYF